MKDQMYHESVPKDDALRRLVANHGLFLVTFLVARGHCPTSYWTDRESQVLQSRTYYYAMWTFETQICFSYTFQVIHWICFGENRAQIDMGTGE